MSLGQTALLKKAKKLELQGSQKNKITPACIFALEEVLNDVYVIRHPKPSDYQDRTDLIRVFNAMAKEIYGNFNEVPVVEEFGSFVMDMFSAKSDLDLSINFGDNAVELPREKKIQTLRKFAKKLYTHQRRGHVFNVQAIMSARVPIVKVIDRGTGIECDISVENRDGIAKSKIVHMICKIDERFQKLSFLMKAWAKAHDINSSKDRTLNSLSIISLVAFHLQTRDPPILPPFSAIFKDGNDPANVKKNVRNFLNYGKKNRESLAELFVTLLVKLASVETLWSKGLCASAYEGSWIYKTWDSKVGCISVEDFTDRFQNVARAVGTSQVCTIYNCIHHSLRSLLAFMDDQIQGPKLSEMLFGPDLIPTLDKDASELPISLDPILTKRVRSTEGGEGRREAHGLEGSNGPILKKKMRRTEGWEGRRVAHGETSSNVTSLFTPSSSYQTLPFASSLGNRFPIVSTQNPIGLEGSNGPFLQLPFDSQQNPLGFYGPRNLNPVVPMPYLNPVVPMPYVRPIHAQRAQPSHNNAGHKQPFHLYRTW